MISFLITHKNEKHLHRTLEAIDANAEGHFEILEAEDDGRGQRAMLNKLASKARYDILCKVDAHCTFGPDFDTILLSELKDNMVLAPLMFPLDDTFWTINHHNKMGKFGFNTEMAVDHLPGSGESMCMQGSFFMVHKKNYWEWNLCDESLGSWGHQGTELGIQTFLHGGVCYISDKTYYGHVFRHSDSDFPYERDATGIKKTHKLFIERFRKKNIAPLIEKFDYPFDWSQSQVNKLLT